MTLHEAIGQVLADHKSRSASELAAEVNRRRLYTGKDGKPVPPNQISARVKNYPYLFIREGGKIRLA